METKRYLGLPDVHHGPLRRDYPLLAPLRYLRIGAPAKRIYDFVLPTICAAILCILYVTLNLGPAATKENGILSDLQSLLTMAVPFLIGALATVAMASPVDALDKRPAGAEIVFEGRVLSLRQFVCYLLGYLSFVGFVLLLMIFSLRALSPPISVLLDGFPRTTTVVESVTVVLFAWIISSLCLTILWALYFLTDVVNRR